MEVGKTDATSVCVCVVRERKKAQNSYMKEPFNA